jgi:hypothetical protein
MNKNKEYVVDSTKGSSMINPLNYKGDVLVQVWVDSRVLATIVRWMDSKGNYPRFMSQGVRRPLEVLTGFLVDNGEVEMVEDTDEARTILTRRFNIDLNRGGRGTKNVTHNLALSDRRNDLGERIQASSRINDVSRPMRGQNDPNIAALVEEAKRVYKEKYPDGEKEVNHYDYETSKEEVKRVDDNKVVKSEDAAEFVKVARVEREVPLLKERGNSRETIEARIRKADEDSQKELDALNSFDPMSLMSEAVKEKSVE